MVYPDGNRQKEHFITLKFKCMKKKSSDNNLIERQISSIFDGIVSNIPDGLVAVRNKPLKGSSLCKGLVKIYKKAEIEKASAKDRKRVNPIEMYAFFMKNFQETQLESIAIYGEGAYTKYVVLKTRGVLFGYRIADLKVETGFRPFLDVKLS